MTDGQTTWAQYLRDYGILLKLRIQNIGSNFLASFSLVCIFIATSIVALFFLSYGAVVTLGSMFGDIGISYLVVGSFLLVCLVSFWQLKFRKYQRAIASLKVTLHKTQQELIGPNLSETIQKHPWIATGIATTTGFIASSQIYSKSNNTSSHDIPFYIPMSTRILDIAEKALTPLILDFFYSRH